MPKIKANSRPLIKCAFTLCDINFPKWRKRLYHSDACRKNAWRYNNKEYYRAYVDALLARKKKERQQTLRYQWGVEGEVPERLELVEAIAQASPATLEQIRELLPDVDMPGDG